MTVQKIHKIIVAAQLIWFCCIWNDACSQVEKFLTRPFENKVFIEEQGQFKKSLEENKITVPGTILFAVNNPEFNAYFTDTGITFLFSQTEKTDKNQEESHEKKPVTKREIVNMTWVNANPSMHITAKEKVSSYYTYGRYADNSQYDHVSAYKKLFYSNIYEGVDAEFEFPENGGIKYQFIVRAGFKIPAITYQMDGTKNLYLDEKGNLHIEAALGNLIDKAPIAFTKSAKTPVKYSITGNRIVINCENKTSSLTEDMVIDPWFINPALPSSNIACDIQEDSVGNVFINGGTSGSGSYQVQKYNSAGVWQWSHNYTCTYYGDIAVANSGSVYLAEGITGRVIKLSSAGAVIYAITEGSENWRLSFNKSKTILALGGNLGSNSLAKIDTITGLFTNLVSYPSDTWAVATDCNGDIYSLHYGSSPCILRKTYANFTPATSLITSPGFCISGYVNARAYASGYNALTISGPYLYVYDGLQLRRFLKNTLTFVNSVAVSNGAANNCSGIAFDYCGNIYVGTMSTIEKYDASLNFVSSIPAPNIVYDIILAGNGDLLACGKSFVGNFGPTCPFPPQLAVTDTSTNVSCKPGTASVLATGGTLPYSYFWQPGGQTTALVTGLTPGTYTYTVNDVFCQSMLDSVTVLQTAPLLLSQGTIIKESCQNSLNGSATVNASGGTAPYAYSWNTNPVQHTQTATGLSAGTYLATVVDADTCIDTISVIVTRNPDPVAAFSNTTVCNNSATQFTDNSTTSSGTITAWTWNYGDSSPFNTTPSPSHTYSNAGNYNVTLTVNNNFGCAHTITKAVQVYYNPVASYTSADVCFRDTMHFINTSSVNLPASISSYLWVFGDGGTTSNAISPAHYYASHGTYTVTLIAITTNGCSDVVNTPVKAFDPPASAFTFNNTCLMDSAVFINTSLNPLSGTIASCTWNFGDGSPLIPLTGFETLSGVGLLYAAQGSYQVTLITHSSNLGCPDTVQHTITVFPMPVAKFGFTNVCLNQPMNFHDSSTVSSGSVAGWSWNFGDATPLISIQHPSHIYASPGTYTATLIVTTNNGCKDTIAKSVVVHPLPIAQFSAANVCDGDSVNFNNLSTIAAPDVLQSYIWNYGNGAPPTTLTGFQTLSGVLYPAAASYAVKLLAVSTFGCRDSITKTSIVHPNPIVNFNTLDIAGCEPWCVNFRDTSLLTTGNNTQWLWNFGDNSPTSSLKNPTHCYTNDSVFSPLSFTPSLTVTSDSGCVNTKSKNNYITVYPKPDAGFGVQPDTASIINPIVSVSDFSTGANFWNWNFGDNDTTSKHNPTPHTYADTGSYTITLITSTHYTCSDTAYQNIYIEPDFLFYIPNAFTPNDDGVNDSFSGKGIFIKTYEMGIYDRWGNLVFFTDDINKGWDGKANYGTEIAQRDVYIYSIKVTGINKRKYSYKGIVTLVR